MDNSYWKQLDDVKQDLKKMSKTFTSELAKKAETDMIQAHDQIITQYYKYQPNSYHRKSSGNLFYSIISHDSKHSNTANSHYAKVRIGSSSMEDHTRSGYKGVNQGNVFDLVWNEGIRGLPSEGVAPLSQESVDKMNAIPWLAGKPYRAGEVWRNPYWGSQYNNEFRASISINDYTTSNGKPDDVMNEFVENWNIASGEQYCDDIAEIIRSSF